MSEMTTTLLPKHIECQGKIYLYNIHPFSASLSLSFSVFPSPLLLCLSSLSLSLSLSLSFLLSLPVYSIYRSKCTVNQKNVFSILNVYKFPDVAASIGLVSAGFIFVIALIVVGGVVYHFRRQR